jgi:hypothetical protein
MKCILCKTEETTILIKGVPAEICNKCGEYYLKNYGSGREAVKKGVEVEILRFAA